MVLGLLLWDLIAFLSFVFFTEQSAVSQQSVSRAAGLHVSLLDEWQEITLHLVYFEFIITAAQRWKNQVINTTKSPIFQIYTAVKCSQVSKEKVLRGLDAFKSAEEVKEGKKKEDGEKRLEREVKKENIKE